MVLMQSGRSGRDSRVRIDDDGRTKKQAEVVRNKKPTRMWKRAGSAAASGADEDRETVVLIR